MQEKLFKKNVKKKSEKYILLNNSWVKGKITKWLKWKHYMSKFVEQLQLTT